MRWTIGFAVWTLLVWGGRVRNIVADESLDGFGVTWRIGLSLSFVTFAVATLIACWRASHAPTWPARLVRPFAVFTTAVWVVRAGGILLDSSHEAGFKVVHTVLAIGSVALAWIAARESTAHARRFEPVSRASVS